MLILCILYDTFNVHAISHKSLRDTITGVIVGLIAIAVMLSPWSLQPGVFFDTRWVLLSLCGLFFGFTPTIIAVCIAGTFRLYQGGTGGVAGTIVIISTAFTGLAWRYFLKNRNITLTWKQLYLFGVLVQLVMLSCMILMPPDMRIPIIITVAPPILTIYPFLTLLLGMILLRQEQRRETDRALLREINERKAAEKEVRESHEEWENTFNSITEIVTLQDTSFRIIKANKAAAEAVGIKPEKMTGRFCYQIFAESDQPCGLCPLPHTAKTLSPHSLEITNQTLGKTFLVSGSPVLDEKGRLTHLTHVAKDLTEQKKLEENLFQAQKMESIGTLAGGIAHDFNNILTAILGYAELAKLKLPPENKARSDIAHIQRSGERAADLVRQILTFSRKSDHFLEPLQMHRIVHESIDMLRASLPSTIKIKDHVDDKSGLVMADPTNIQQIVINLCTNAVHAMENEKGTLHISLYAEHLKPEQVISEKGESNGSFVVLEIKDSGHGMDEQTLAIIFEPYFTTKKTGKGTGLGLSVIHGIVKDYRGFIRVKSKPGTGSTFTVFLPEFKENLPLNPTSIRDEKTGIRGDESILIVDDELPLLNVNQTILERLGYKVTATHQSKKALELIRNHPDRFNIVISDQTMPEMTGIELSRKILKRCPDIPIIICTGYSAVINEEETLAAGVKKYLAKPVSGNRLAQTIRTVLDSDV